MKPTALVFAIAAVVLLVSNAHAQEETKAIVLKDGSVITGTITRQTDDTLEVQVADSTIMIPTSAVRRIQNLVGRGGPKTTEGGAPLQSPAPIVEDAFRTWEIIAGVGIPTGRFAKEDLSAIGFASTGACLGFLYRIDIEKGFEVGFKEVIDYYPFDKDAYARYFPSSVSLSTGSWFLFWTMGSFGVHLPVAPEQRFHVGALIGYALGFSPSLSASNGSMSVSQSSAGAWAFGYGAEIGFSSHGADIEFRYLAADFEYPFSTTNRNEVAFRIKQPTATLQVTAGVAFR